MNFYFKFRVTLDWLIATAIALSVYSIHWRSSPFPIPPEALRQQLGIAMLGAATSLLGFVLAGSTFLMSHLQSESFTLIRRSRSFHQLPYLVASNIWRLFALSIASALALLVNNSFALEALTVLALCTTLSCFALAALLWVIVRIYAIPLRD
jgi:hypothetical protein